MRKIANIGKKAYLVVTLVLLSSCLNDKPKDVVYSSTAIVYMVADNNLSGYAIDNINKMERAYDPNSGGKVLVLYNKRGGGTQIIEIVSDQSSSIVSKVLYTYPSDTDPNSPATLSDAIQRCRDFSPTDSYGIVFWSHATGWLPYGMHPARNVYTADAAASQQRSFGGGNLSGHGDMEIYEMAAALPTDMKFEYIYFDACHMASIEAVYELRHRAKYIIGSVAETLAEGYPYHTGLGSLISGDVVGIASNFYGFYETRSSFMRSATISVVDASKLDEVAKQIGMLPAVPELTAVQQYGRYLGYSSDYRNLMWDMADLAQRTWGSATAAPLLQAIDEAVVYKASTPMLFQGDMNGQIEVATHCGLSIYIPKLSQPQTLEIYKNNYSWAQDTKLYERAK